MWTTVEMPEPCNILRVITWLPPGGIEKKIAAVLPRLDREWFLPRVLCLRERGAVAAELESAGIPVDLIALKSRLDPVGIWRMAQYMRRHEIALVHAHMYRAAVPATIAARMAGVPIVTQVHNVNTWESARQVRMDRFLVRWRSAMIGVSEVVRQDIIQTLGLDPAKARLVYNGVDLREFSPAENPAEAKRAMGFDEDAVVVLMAARLVEQKNPQGFIEAAKRLAPRFPRAIFIMAGEGKLKEELQQSIVQAGLQDRVRLLGLCQTMAPVYQAADLFVLPSFKEGFSNALIEAMACGLPIVATRVGGAPEALEGGMGGTLVESGDQSGLEEAIAGYLGNEDFRKTKAEESRQRAQRFSLERMVEDVQSLYAEVLGKSVQ